MYKSIILPPAKEDIRSAANWYNAKSKGLGKRFTSEVRKSIRYTQKNPKACMIRYDQIRTIVLKVFPFMVHYYLDEEKTAIVIIAVLHTSMNPDKWVTRK